MTPDLTSYDFIEFSSSGGKDSLAMKSYGARRLREAGLLRRGVVVHADLGRVEWPNTPELVERQAAHLGLRFMKVKRPQGDLLDHVEALGKWPMPTQRFCTADHKRGQILTVFTALAKESRARGVIGRPVRILNCIGLRAEESSGRAKRLALVRDKRASSRHKEVDVWLPIQGWTEDEVWAECRASGAPIHPAYAAGLPRASCVFCIYMPEDALRIAGALHPELLRRVRRRRAADRAHVQATPPDRKGRRRHRGGHPTRRSCEELVHVMAAFVLTLIPTTSAGVILFACSTPAGTLTIHTTTGSLDASDVSFSTRLDDLPPPEPPPVVHAPARPPSRPRLAPPRRRVWTTSLRAWQRG